jgi:Mg2+ and Co2+ transporter CorA
MTTPPGEADKPIRTSSGVLRARPLPGQTFHDRDPHTLAASAICRVSPTRCQARTRLYRDARPELASNRLNVITKKVTGGAAIIAVPTLITGYFGMNVPYPGFGDKTGLVTSIATIVLSGLVLYLIFKRKDWL